MKQEKASPRAIIQRVPTDDYALDPKSMAKEVTCLGFSPQTLYVEDQRRVFKNALLNSANLPSF